MLHICLRVHGQSFVEPPFKEEILSFIRFLGHSAVEHKVSKKSNEMYYPRFTKVIIYHFMSKDPSIPRRNKVNWHYVRDDHMFFTIKLVSRHQNMQQFGALLPIELTNKEIRKSNAYKEYYAVATGATPPKPKASVRKTRSSSDTTITPPLLLQNSTEDEGDDEGKDGDSDEEDDDGEEGDGDDDDEENDEDRSLNVGMEEGHDKEEDEDELYRDVNINQERGIQATLEVEDSHVTLTPVNPDGQQQSSSVSSQFVTSMLNLTLDVGMESIFETTSQMDAQTLTSVAHLPMTAPTMTPFTIATITTTSQAPIPPTIALGTIIQDLPNFGLLFSFDNRLRTLEANFSEFMQTNQFAKAVSAIPGIVQRYMDQRMNEAVKVAVQIQFKPSPIEQTANEQLEAEVLTRSSHSSKTSYAVATDLSDMELKKILIEKMEGNKSIQRSDEQRNLYKAFVEAYESDKIILDTYGETIMLKRRRDDDADKDEEPSAGPDGGSKRRKEGKEPESASAPTETATRSAGRSTQGSQSRQASTSNSALAEEPMQTTFKMEEPSHPKFDTGAEDQPIVQSSQHPEWFSKQQKPPSPDRDWNKTVPATHGCIQPWISELTKLSDYRSSFNELMDTPLDFFNFLINRLKMDTLTPKLLAGPTYELMKGHVEVWTMWIKEPIGYDKHALWGVSHWGRKRQQFYGFAVNREFAHDVYSKGRIIAVTELKIVEWLNYKHLDWITRRVEDLQLGVESYQKKLNLTKPDTYRSDLKHKEAYIAYSNPRGFIYQNKDKKNRLMRIDELHKFSDGTLNDVRTALDDRLKGIRMQYLPESIWRKSDKDRATAMIQAIDKRLKTRRIMRSLERFVGGRLYEGDFRMLQRTI
uniref:Integrase, catalytic region, zinc finger, CCHC-type, peptidase aspartic, catalytic n=1 Tax=Tanacetum cinerariifolium TaxID=118510 RepID=A0A699IS09_TANCI|nr:hypothetical protein [Tanacetum cinerariifolium]